MSVVRVDQYRSDGRLKLGRAGWTLYAAFTEMAPGKGLVKIGTSTVPLRRLYDVHAGSPFPIAVALWTHIGTKSQATRAENYLKRRFADRQTRGDWFTFDLAQADDKEDFHRTCRAAYARVTGELLQWRKVTLEQIRVARQLMSADLRA